MMEAACGRYAVPRVNILENDEAFMIEAELPGVERDAADVQLENGHLILRAERRAPAGDSTVKLRERPDAGYYRVFSLNEGIDGEHVEATMMDGVLTLVLPKAEAVAQRRHIEICGI